MRRYPPSFDDNSDSGPGRLTRAGVTGAQLGWADVSGEDDFRSYDENPDLVEEVFTRADLDEASFGTGRYTGQPAVSHRGRGPRNFERTDEQLREAICERLTEDEFVDPGDVSVLVQDGEVTLEGTVERRDIKYRVEDIVESCSGVKEIHNHLSVAPQEPQEDSPVLLPW